MVWNSDEEKTDNTGTHGDGEPRWTEVSYHSSPANIILGETSTRDKVIIWTCLCLIPCRVFNLIPFLRFPLTLRLSIGLRSGNSDCGIIRGSSVHFVVHLQRYYSES